MTSRALPVMPVDATAASKVRDDPLGFLEAGTLLYGDVFSYTFNGWCGVLVNRPEYVREILHASPERYSKLKTPDLTMLEPMLGKGLMTTEGELWQEQRRMAQPRFLQDQTAGYAAAMIEATDSMLQRWEALADSGRLVDMEAEFSRLTIQIVAGCLFGIDLSEEGADVGRAIASMNDFVAYFDPDDPVRRVAYEDASLMVHQLVQRILLERRFVGQPGDDLLEDMMGWKAEAQRAGQTWPPLADQIFTYLMAGHETTAKTLTWAVYLLDRHPDEARRVCAEVAAAGDWRRRGDVPAQLPYTWAVVQETLRLYPPVWLMSRRCVSGENLDGYHIPAGSLVVVSPYTLHRRPQCWREPLEFRPSRFGPTGTDAPVPYSYFPFSGGRRMCIGRRFATVETVIVLASITERFRCRLEPGTVVEPQALVTLRPRNGMPMYIESRR